MGLFKKKENGENTNTNTNNTASQGATSNKGINVNDARSMRQMKSTYTPKTTTTKSRLNATEAQKRDITQKVQTKNANKSINVNNANQMRDLKSSYANNQKNKINESLSNKTSFNDSRFIAKKKENPYQQDIDNYDKQLKEIDQAYRVKLSGDVQDTSFLGQYDKYGAQELNDMYANIEKERNSLKRINDTEHAINKQLNDTNKDAVYKESDIFDYNNGQVNIKDFTKELSYLNNEINTLQSQMDLIGFDEYGKVNDEEKYQSLNSEKYKLEKQRDELSKKQSYQDAYVGKLIFDNAVANKDTETLSQLHNQFGSYNDNALERTGKATAQIPVNIYATALSTVDIVRDYVGDKLADKLEETANFLRENGQIDEKRFNEFLEDAKKLSNFEADDPNNYSTEMRELANQLSYESMNGLNGVNRFVAEGLSSTANFFTQFYLFGATGSLVSMGLQSGSQKYFENLQKGYSKDVAFANAVATGLISYATERIGMDNFVSILNGTANKGAMAQLVNQIAQGKGNIAIIMNNVISQGLAEGLEEMVEGNADFVLDHYTARFFDGEPVEYSAGDLFYGMLVGAFSGAITGGMGSIDTYNAVVNTREQYNQLRNDVASLMQMRNEAVLNKEDTTSIDKAIKIGEMALNNFETDAKVSMAVTLPQDMVDTNLSPEGVLKETENILGPNIDQAVTDTLAQEQLENNVYNIAQEFMSYNNINEDAREFINLDENRRQNVIDGSKYGDRLNIRVGYSLNVPGDGYYDPQTKTIMINPNSQLGEVSTLIHELTHFNEDSSIYKTLSELAEESYGVNAKERVQEIKNEYKKFFKSIGQDPNKVNDDYAQREFTAIETQDQLGNDEFVQKLIHYNESLVYRIYDNIKAMTSSDVKTRLENTFARAFREVQKQNLIAEGNLQYSAGGTTGLSALMYSDDPETRALGQELNNKLDEAIRLDQEGLNTEWTIWEKTGWIKKADGFWRFQFYDGADKTAMKLMTYLSRADGKTVGWLDGTLSLSDFIDENNILFKMYPELKNLVVSFYADESDKNTLGKYSPGEDLGDGFTVLPSISFNLARYRYLNGYLNLGYEAYDEITETFFHELQHAIQDIEGFENGSNLTLGAREYVANTQEKARKERDRLAEKLQKTGLTERQINNFIREYRDSYMFSEDTRNQLSEQQQQMIRELSEVIYDVYDERAPYDKAFEIYQNNLGEIEAREEGRRALYEKDRVKAPEYDGRLKPDYLGGNANRYSIGLSEDEIKKVAPNSFDKNGNIKNIDVQLNEMLSNPGTYGYTNVSVGNKLNFMKIKGSSIFMDNKALKHSLRHLTLDEIAMVLNKIPKDTVLGLDYKDVRGGLKKTIVVETDGNIYLISTSVGSSRGVQIDEIDNLLNKTGEFEVYLEKSQKMGNKVYLNEKSDEFLSRFSLQNTGGVDSNTTSKHSFSLGLSNVNSEAKTNLDNFLKTNEEIIEGLGLLDGYTGANTQAGNLDTNLNYANQTREQVLNDNIENMLDSVDDELEYFLENYEITQDELGDYRNELVGWLTDPYSMEGSAMENVSYETRDMFGELMADYLIDKYSSNVYQAPTYNSDGAQLTPQQQKYFKNSKIRDENGNLLVVYHGTDADFNEFNMRDFGKDGETAEGFGIYLTDNPDVANAYGERSIKAYANITNPATSFSQNINQNTLEKLIKATVEKQAEEMVADGDYQTLDEAIRDTWISNYTNTYEKSMDDNYQDVAKNILRMNDNDMNVIQEIMSGMGARNYQEAYDFYDTLKKTTGIDGFETEWVANDGTKTKIFIAFDSNQVKNTDNSNPSSSSDIRYSIGLKSNTDSDGKTLSNEQQDYFKNTKITNDKGQLLRVYHGTRGDFYIFDRNQGGQSNSKAGIGFWFTPSKQGATNFANDIWYGDNDTRVIESYLNITNPYIYEEVNNTELLESIENQIDDIDKEIKKIKETASYIMMDDIGNRYYVNMLPNPIQKLVEEGYKEDEARTYVEQYTRVKELQQLRNQLKKEHAEGRYTDPYEQFKTDIYKLAGQSAEDANIGGIGMGLNNPSETLEKYRNSLIEQGYDGIILKGTRYDSGVFGGNNDQYVAFYPEQIKSVDNLEPTTNPDIRYSLGETNKSDTQNSVSPEIQAGLDANQEAIDKYGAYGLGNKPVRDLQIARRTDDGPVSRFINNIVNSNYVSDEEAVKIQSRFKELGKYEETSNKKQIKEARKMIQQMGLEDSYKYIMNADSLTTVDVDNVFLQQLVNEFKLKGLEGTPAYYELIARGTWRSSMSGKALQAFNEWRTQSPEGQIITIRSEIERIQQGLSERYGEGTYNIQINEGLIEEYLRAKTQEERDEIRLQIAMEVAKQIPPTIMEQLNSFRHLSMLFNPRTWVKNRLANELFGYINETTRAVRTIGEAVAQNMGVEIEREAGIYNPLSKQERALYKEFVKDFDANFKNRDMKYTTYDVGNILLDSEFGKEVSENRDQFTSAFLNKLSEINAKKLSDRPGLSKAYAKTMVGYFKVNNLSLDTITEEQMQKAREFAYREARHATFNADNKLATWLVNANRELAKRHDALGYGGRALIESFIPFKRTPLNLMATGARYTPAGLAYTLTNDLAQLKKGKITANQFIDNLSQGLVGSGIMALGALLFNLGIFRTKDDDKDRKKYFDQDNGEQDYSINWDGGSYTIDWADPMIIPLAMGAEVMKMVNDGAFTLDDAYRLMSAMAEPLFETSMLSGITNNLQSYANDSTGYITDIIANAGKNYLSQYIPSVLGALARTIDDTRRTTYTSKDEKSLLNNKFTKQVKNKIPGLSQTNQPYINRKGEVEKNEDWGMGIAGRAVLQFLSPGYYSSKDIDEYDEEMYRLYDETGDLNALPSSTNKSLTHEGETYNFSSEQYTQWQETRWQTEAEYVNQFMDSNAYGNLTDEERVETIKDIRTYAQKVAKKQFLESQGYKYTDDKELADSDDEYIYDKQLVQAQGALDNDIELYAYYDYLNNSGSKQAEKMAYLEESGLSQKQKEYLWSLNDYKKSYADVYASVFGSDSSKSTKKKKSSKSSKKGSSGKSSSKKKKKGKTGTAGAGGGLSKASRVSTPTASRMATGNKEQEAKVVNKYLSAYSSSMRKGNKNVSKGSAQVVCYKCKNRVTPVNGKCPICGASL